MKYSISDSPLRLREYGRNIQSMVEYLGTIEDRDQRTAAAHEIVRFMTCLNPSIKENPDYKNKLWDHLYLIADGKLEVDAPFEIPEEFVPPHFPVEERMAYPSQKPKRRQFGKKVDLMIQKALEMDAGPERDAYINIIANTMKLFIGSVDRNANPEEVIADQMANLSGGKLTVDPNQIKLTKMPPKGPPQQSSSSRSKGAKKRRSKGGSNYRRSRRR